MKGRQGVRYRASRTKRLYYFGTLSKAEWAEHEAKIWADYDARRAALEAPPGGAIEGRFKHSPPRRSTVAAALGSNGGGRDFGHGNGGVSGHEASWHTREKQVIARYIDLNAPLKVYAFK